MLWQEMGQPEYFSANDVEQLHAASQMIKESRSWVYDQGTIWISNCRRTLWRPLWG